MLPLARLGLSAIVVCATGCASLGWRIWPEKRSYQFEREVTVEVQSSPSGATVFEDGKPIGTAPFTYRGRHKVERTRRSRSAKAIVPGCALDLIGSAVLFTKWFQGFRRDDDDPIRPALHAVDSNRQRLLLIGGVFAFGDCALLAVLVGAKHLAKDFDLGGQAPTESIGKHTIHEHVIPRTVALEARWPDWSPTRVELTIPAQSLVTLRRGHANTFDDALVRHTRAGLPLSAGGLIRAGQTYHRMAIETNDPAHARTALELFERYLASDGAERRVEVEKWIAELRTMAAAK